MNLVIEEWQGIHLIWNHSSGIRPPALCICHGTFITPMHFEQRLASTNAIACFNLDQDAHCRVNGLAFLSPSCTQQHRSLTHHRGMHLRHSPTALNRADGLDLGFGQFGRIIKDVAPPSCPTTAS